MQGEADRTAFLQLAPSPVGCVTQAEVLAEVFGIVGFVHKHLEVWTCRGLIMLRVVVGIVVMTASAGAYSFVSCANYDKTSSTCYGER